MNTLQLFPETAQITSEGRLSIAGHDVPAIAGSYGTPLYLYDRFTLLSSVDAYRAALSQAYSGESRIAYGAKAFLCTGLASLLAEEEVGLDVVSGGELYIALRAGYPPEHIHFHGNNKNKAELEMALKADIGRIVVDNFHELEMLTQLAQQETAIWLRVSPDVDAHTHAYRKTGLLDTKFGFPVSTGDAARATIQANTDRHLRLRGVHAHIGSQIFEAEPYLQTIEALLDFTDEMRRHGILLEEISPGGGLGVPYTLDDPSLEVEDYIRMISRAVEAGATKRGLPLPKLTLEPGRSLVARAGVAVYTVGARKFIPGLRTYLSVDGGMADNIRPPLYGARYSALLANRAGDPPEEAVRVVGKYCESGDVLIHDVTLPVAHPGDLLAVPVSGAYQLSLSSNYNGSLRPAVLLLSGGDVRVWQRREAYEDLTNRDV